VAGGNRAIRLVKRSCLSSVGDKSNREDSQRIRIRIREIDGEVAKLIRLIGDQAIADMAKKSISRELATFEQDRQQLQSELERLADEANDNTEEIAKEVRTVMAELKQGLVAPNTKELRGIIEEFVGPIVLLADGTVAQANASAEVAEAYATGLIAGARHDTRRMPLTTCLPPPQHRQSSQRQQRKRGRFGDGYSPKGGILPLAQCARKRGPTYP
jgi:hypothetical protein